MTALYVDAGDEILVPDPGYPGYRHFVRAFEGVAKTLPVSAATDFQPTLRDGARSMGPAHQGAAARLSVQPHRHADFKK